MSGCVNLVAGTPGVIILGLALDRWCKVSGWGQNGCENFHISPPVIIYTTSQLNSQLPGSVNLVAGGEKR